MRWIAACTRSILDQELLAADRLAALDLDAILDSRESASFDDAWVTSWHTIEHAWSARSMAPEGRRAVRVLRRVAFLATSRATCQHEVAGCVSDDFELLGKAALLGIDTPFLAGLWAAYASGTIPGRPAQA